MEKKEEKPHIHPYEKSSTRLKFPEILVNNFMGGIAWALGATVGLSLVIALLTFIAQNINFSLIPVVGTFISNVIDFVITTNPNLNK